MNQYDLLFLLFTSVQCNALPNFLILFPDQWRSEWAASFEGLTSLHMPFFESLANNGTRFRNAFVPSPLCAPSRACLTAGREYDLAGVPDNFSNDYPLSIPTFYQLLEKAGYYVMTSGKDDLTKSSGPGINGQYHAKELGFSNFARTEGKEDVLKSNIPTDPYGNFCLQHNISTNEGNISLWDVLLKKDSDCCFNVKGSSGYFCEIPSIIPQFAYEDDFVTDLSITMLETKPKTVPWLLQVSFPGPHPPFIVTSSMQNLTLTEDYPPAVDNTILSQKDGLDIKRLYAAELQHIDTLFQRIVNKVVDIGDIDNTIVIISSDHGEMLGDHMDWGKNIALARLNISTTCCNRTWSWDKKSNYLWTPSRYNGYYWYNSRFGRYFTCTKYDNSIFQTNSLWLTKKFLSTSVCFIWFSFVASCYERRFRTSLETYMLSR